MKCYSCHREPIRACLMCGSFYCSEHGKFNEIVKFNMQMPFSNSLCEECASKRTSQTKKLSLIFGLIALVELPIGLVIMIASNTFMPGGIFLLQGILFGMISLFFIVKEQRDQQNRRI